MEAAFDPLNLDPSVSLNRTRLTHADVDPSVRGKQAWELIALNVLRDAVLHEAPDLVAPGEDAMLALDRGLAASDRRAVALAERFGRYLGCLVLSLLDPDGELTPYQRHWTGMRNVRLGGGIVSAHLGHAMQRAAQGVLDAAGRSDVSLEVAPHPRLLPLIGAALGSRADDGAALVLDFGSTAVKAAVAHYGDGALVALEQLPASETGGLPDALANTASADDATGLADFMTSVIADSWRHAVATNATLSREVSVSIACYLRDGQPLAYGAGYASLRLLSDNAARSLSAAVSQKVGTEIKVTLSHDGTTAARVFAGQSRAAVIMLGTWLGVGFAPEDASGLRPLAPGFRVI